VLWWGAMSSGRTHDVLDHLRGPAVGCDGVIVVNQVIADAVRLPAAAPGCNGFVVVRCRPWMAREPHVVRGVVAPGPVNRIRDVPGALQFDIPSRGSVTTVTGLLW
jgi:hypothetical protein